MAGPTVTRRTRRVIPYLVGIVALGSTAPASAAIAYKVGSTLKVSAACSGQNAESEQAVDPKLGYVYEAWMGCSGIGFARSTDRGKTFQSPITVPDSPAAWDPAVAVASDGTVYVVFMVAQSNRNYPVVAASFNHGQTFSQVASLLPPNQDNWGDRPFIAVGPTGTVYVTWNYGPSFSAVKQTCAANGNCWNTAGDFNAVIQKSTNRGKTWSAMSHVSPGYPAGGADSAPLLVEPNGRIDVLYQGYQVTNKTTYALGPAYSYFTSSTNSGGTWSAPVKVGASAGTMSLKEWWIDGAIARDSGGNLYATWDTQGKNSDGSANDIGWVSYSTDHGAHWSAPAQAPSDRKAVPHIIEAAGAAKGSANVGWLSDSNSNGYALYLRAFSIAGGWQSAPKQVSPQFGDPSVWPGDTFGISPLGTNTLAVSWGSAVPTSNKTSEIFAAPVQFGSS